MHIHPSSMDLYAVNPYSAAAEKAVAAQRAADVRKKLMKSPADIKGVASPEEANMVSKWLDPRQSSPAPAPQDDVVYHASAAGKNSDFA